MSNHPVEDLFKALPEMAKQIKTEADSFGRTLLEGQLKKADIVTRQEFEEQKALLNLALEKLNQLEEKYQANNQKNQSSPS